jgi:hypothetical protein
MKRFDRAIKVLSDERFRIIGKVADDAVNKKHNPSYAVRARMAIYLTEAIDILGKHERNKNV